MCAIWVCYMVNAGERRRRNINFIVRRTYGTEDENTSMLLMTRQVMYADH
jgi:hypothetical protein